MLKLAGSLRSVDPVLFEGVCLLECLGRLGFAPDQMHVFTGVVADPTTALLPERVRQSDTCLFVRLTANARPREIVVLRGTRAEHGAEHVHEATTTIAVGPVEVEGFDARWSETLQAVERAPRSEGARAFYSSRAWSRLATLRTVIQNKGIPIPRDAS